jgi:hypothetical protein
MAETDSSNCLQLGGQGPHEVTYPYLDTQPKLACPAPQKTYNSGAVVKIPMEDFYCSEEKLKAQVTTSSFFHIITC